MFERLEAPPTLTANQWRIIAAAILGDMLEFFDYFLIGFVLAFIVGLWQLSFGQSAIILLSSGIGAIPGAAAWGRLADTIGRRAVFIGTVNRPSKIPINHSFRRLVARSRTRVAGLGVVDPLAPVAVIVAVVVIIMPAGPVGVGRSVARPALRAGVPLGIFAGQAPVRIDDPADAAVDVVQRRLTPTAVRATAIRHQPPLPHPRIGATFEIGS
jgi:MFS family permease